LLAGLILGLILGVVFGGIVASLIFYVHNNIVAKRLQEEYVKEIEELRKENLTARDKSSFKSNKEGVVRMFISPIDYSKDGISEHILDTLEEFCIEAKEIVFNTYEGIKRIPKNEQIKKFEDMQTDHLKIALGKYEADAEYEICQLIRDVLKERD